MSVLNSLARALAAAAILLFAAAAPMAAGAAEADRGVLADLISKLLSSGLTSVSIGAVDGALSSDAVISDIVLSDRQGPWLKVDKVKIVWNRLALLKRHVDIDELSINHLQLLRRPLPAEVSSAPSSEAAYGSADAPLLPELPVKLIVRRFAITALDLDAAVAGVAARLAISGKATLGPPSEGLDLHLEARRSDAPGAFAALLNFIPASKLLTLNLDFDEPAGGIVARLANLPGTPPVKLKFGGAGPLDAFKATLNFTAGDSIGASGAVNLERQGAGRRLTLDLKSRLEGLMPGIAAAVFAGDTALQGQMLLNDDSSIAIPGLHLVSANARLDIEGGASATQQIDLKIHAGAIPGAKMIGKLDLNASAKGPLESPALDLAFDAGQIDSGFGTLNALVASLSARPSGAITDSSTRIALAGHAAMSGLALADGALNEAIGSDAKLEFRGAATPAGAITFETLQLNAAALSANFSGLVSAAKILGRFNLEAPDLAHFAGLSVSGLKGEARLAGDLDAAPRTGAARVALDGRATNFAAGYAIADRLIGGQLTVKGVAKTLPGGGYGFENLKLDGAHVAMRLDGAAASDKVALSAEIDAPDARFINPAITGDAAISAALTGALAHLSANLSAKLGAGRLLDRPTAGIEVKALAKDITGLIDADISANGDVDHKPLIGAAHIAKRSDGGWRADKIALDLGSAHIAGDLALGASQTAKGQLSLSAADLDDLSPLLLTKLSGAVEADIALADADGRQDAVVKAKSRRLGFGANHVDGLSVDLTASDIFGARRVAGKAEVDRAEIAGQTVANLKLTASGEAQSSTLDLSAGIKGLAVKAHGQVFAGAPARFELTSFAASGNGRSLALAGPATLSLRDGGLDIKDFALLINGGRVWLDGHAGAESDLRVKLAALPLAAPGLGLAGLADGEATLKGAPNQWSGDWRLRLKGASAPQSRNAGLPALDATASGRFSGQGASIAADINAGAGAALHVAGSLPLSSQGAIDVTAVGRIDAGLIAKPLAVAGRRLSGAVMIDMQLRGPIDKPQATGSAAIGGGAFSDDQLGLKLTNLSARLVGSGDSLTIESFSGVTPNGGAISASGQVKLDASAGFPGAIHIAGRHAQAIATDIVAATADLSIDVTGPLAQRPLIAGRINIASMDVVVPERFAGLAAPLAGTRHVNADATTRARLAQDAKAKSGGKPAPAFNATLALTLSAPNRVFVRGRGINAELSGELTLSGPAAHPQVAGGFDMRRGSLSILGKSLAFTRGRVQFHGDATPDLDFLAETAAGDVTARVGVTGPASQPVFAFSSDPNLPQDEVLARVLFQKPAGNLSPFQAVQLANAVVSLSGGGDNFERLRKSLGVDSLDVGSSASGGPTIGVSRAINDRISIGAKTGAKPQDNGVSVDLDITKHIRLQAGVDASGGSSAGIGAEWEYK